MNALVDALHAAFHRPSAASYAWVNGVVWVLIGASVLLVALDLGLPSPHPWRAPLELLDAVILKIFGVEIALRLLTFRPAQLELFDLRPDQRLRAHVLGRVGFALKPMNLVDIITVLAVLPELRGLRALRLLRLLRGTQIFRYSHPLRGLLRAFEDNALLFTLAFSVLGVEVVVGGVSIYLVEGGGSRLGDAANPNLSTVADGLWWALVTLTTVGFGDISPATGMGRLVGSGLMVGGMFTLALFAGIVGHSLLNTVLSVREEQFRMSTVSNHVVICGYDAAARMLLDALREEIDAEQTTLVLFAAGERPLDVPPEFTWIQGDPTKESELEKARMDHARAAILVGSRAVSPQQADAITLLTAFTIRSHLRKRPASQRRRRPLHIVAEILDAENVEHARTAGVDEVIETTRLGFSLMSHAVAMPGTADVMAALASTEAHNLFTMPAPDLGPEGSPAMRFDQVSAHVRRQHGVLVIGVRCQNDRRARVNPPDGASVKAGDELLYISEEPVRVAPPEEGN